MDMFHFKCPIGQLKILLLLDKVLFYKKAQTAQLKIKNVSKNIFKELISMITHEF